MRPLPASASSRSEGSLSRNAVVVASGPQGCHPESKAEDEADAHQAVDIPAAGPPVRVAKEPAGPRDTADGVHWAVAGHDQLVSRDKPAEEPDAQLESQPPWSPWQLLRCPPQRQGVNMDLLEALDAATSGLPPVVPKDKPKGARKLKKGISKSFQEAGQGPERWPQCIAFQGAWLVEAGAGRAVGGAARSCTFITGLQHGVL